MNIYKLQLGLFIIFVTSMVTKILLSQQGKQKLVIKASFPIFGFCNQKQLNKLQYKDNFIL